MPESKARGEQEHELQREYEKHHGELKMPVEIDENRSRLNRRTTGSNHRSVFRLVFGVPIPLQETTQCAWGRLGAAAKE